MPNLWDHGRNPVRYTSLVDLGIDPVKLAWESMPMAAPRPALAPATVTTATSASLTIAEAKRALAVTFGVKPEAVEITIRG